MNRQEWMVSGLAATIAIAGLIWLLPSGDLVTKENFDAIKVGMTEQEVVSLVGPPGDYRPHDYNPPGFWSGPSVAPLPRAGEKRLYKMWVGQNYAFCIIFDSDGGVASKAIEQVPKERRWNGR